jgi:hypothetical protein
MLEKLNILIFIMAQCAVVRCRNSTKVNKDVIYHRFPLKNSNEMDEEEEEEDYGDDDLLKEEDDKMEEGNNDQAPPLIREDLEYQRYLRDAFFPEEEDA